MASFNKVILMGRLTASPELKQTTSGLSVTEFSVAVDRKYTKGEEKQADFIQCRAWRNTAEFVCKHFKKGNPILMCGQLQTRSYEARDGSKRTVTEVIVDEVSFCGEKQTENAPVSAPTYSPYSQGSQMEFEEIQTDDNLPF